MGKLIKIIYGLISLSILIWAVVKFILSGENYNIIIGIVLIYNYIVSTICFNRQRIYDKELKRIREDLLYRMYKIEKGGSDGKQ